MLSGDVGIHYLQISLKPYQATARNWTFFACGLAMLARRSPSPSLWERSWRVMYPDRSSSSALQAPATSPSGTRKLHKPCGRRGQSMFCRKLRSPKQGEGLDPQTARTPDLKPQETQESNPGPLNFSFWHAASNSSKLQRLLESWSTSQFPELLCSTGD